MYTIREDTLRISVRHLVEFIFSSGNIDNRTGGTFDMKLMQTGSRLHKKIQNSMGISYRAEIPLKLTINIEHKEVYKISLEGRADGIICDFEEDEAGSKIPVSEVTLDEIKSVQSDVDKMKEAVYVHKAQAMCYAYIYALQNDLHKILVQITYCNIDTEQIVRFCEPYSFEELKSWFDHLMEKFQKWTDFIFESKKIRQESIEKSEFPFSYRAGQKQLVTNVYRAVTRKKNLYIQAPTGVGKTVSAIYPAVKAIGEEFGDKIFYLTAKTITRTAAEETFDILKQEGLKFRTVTLTARDKICIQKERDCNPVTCPNACGHFDRVNEAVYDIITHEHCIGREKVLEYAKKHEVCPFEMSLDITYWCDAIICDYNYVFDPNVRLKRFFADGLKGSYLFLIDEAHNLVERARNMYSAQLYKEEFLELKRLLGNADKKMTKYLEKCNQSLLGLKKECDTCQIIESQGNFLMPLEQLFGRMQTFLEEQEGSFEHMDKVSELYLKIRHYLNMRVTADEKYIVYTEHTEDKRFAIHLFCVDPSRKLNACIEQGNCAVFFSATLLPIRYFKEMLTGDLEEYAVYAESPFDTDNRRILIANDVSSRYSRRGIREYQTIAEYITVITAARKGNYMVFFPSYSFMEAVYEQMAEEMNHQIIKQTGFMNESDKEAFLSAFLTQKEETDRGTVGFCVMGGIFSEGIDLKKDSLIGVIIIGTGLPMICNERKILKTYFDEFEKDGFAYAYTYPGMNKVLQAAGRVIRTEEDRGIIALLDDRFLQAEYQNLLPREWDRYYTVNKGNAGECIKEFWSASE